MTTIGPYDMWAIEYAYKPLDAATLELWFAAPVKSVLEDDEGRAITMTTNVTLELPVDVH